MPHPITIDIERVIGHAIRTPKDFDTLSDLIYRQTRAYLSSTTLKRLWGYLDEGVAPSRTTLTILARFLGYNTLEQYLDADAVEAINSDPVLARKIDVATDLAKGDTVTLRWRPGRVCRVVYTGDCTFRVVESQATRLQPDDVFRCSLIIEGEPLYVDLVESSGRRPAAYVCGRRWGVTWDQESD